MTSPWSGRIDWNEDQIDRLKHLWAEGWPASQIAIAIRTSRNSIIGKARRLGLEKRREAPPKRLKRKAKSPAPKPAQTSREKIRAAGLRLIAEREAADNAIAVAGGIPFMEIARNQCRWPLTDSRPLNAFRFCGRHTKHGSYCAEHHARSLSRHDLAAEAAE